MEYIDVTPTWEEILPHWLMIVSSVIDGTNTAPERSMELFREQMEKMSQAADKWNAHCKTQKELPQCPSS